jgi:hypothetical protein
MTIWDYGAPIPMAPAATALFEGRIVEPEVFSICSLPSFSLAGHFAAISAALDSFMAGLDTLVFNPLVSFAQAAAASIQALLADMALVISSFGALLQGAITGLTNALSAVTAAVAAIVSHVANMIGAGFNQIMTSLNFCSPVDKIPSAVNYDADKIAGSLKEHTTIQETTNQVNSIMPILNNSSGFYPTEASKVTALNNATGSLNTLGTTLDTRRIADVDNLAASLKQNDALSKVTNMSAGLNNPLTAGFVTSIMNPSSATMLTGVASSMTLAKGSATSVQTIGIA